MFEPAAPVGGSAREIKSSGRNLVSRTSTVPDGDVEAAGVFISAGVAANLERRRRSVDSRV